MFYHRRCANAVEIKEAKRCVKMILPNKKVVDILSPVFEEITKWIQDEEHKPESGGFIIGYQHSKTGNISLENVSHPYKFDYKSRVRFKIRDPRHKLFLRKSMKQKSYYMGTWHAHPQITPIPSIIDLEDWQATLSTDKTGCEYVFFIIAGIKDYRIWAGDFKTKEIFELLEAKKNEEGVYCENIKNNL